MLAVDIGPKTDSGPPRQALSLLETLKIAYPAVTTADEHVQDEYKLLGLAPTYFINSEGQITQSWTGFLTKEKLEELARALIEAERQPPGERSDGRRST